MKKLQKNFALIQRGFTLVELIVTISIAALLAVYAQAKFVQEQEEVLAESAAEYLMTVANGAGDMVNTNFNLYVNSQPVTGVATLLQPTLAELKALGFIHSAFPIGANSLPTRQTVQVTIQQSNCPGATCSLQILACTTTPVTLGGANVRWDLASTMVSAQKGRGGQSLQGAGSWIRGPNVLAANPVVNTEGIVCGAAVVNTAVNQAFVKMNDTRDPNLQGNLTVAGATTFNGPSTVNNNLTVTGNVDAASMSLGPCINMAGATGRAGFGCTNGADLPVGYVGGVRSADVVANRSILASDNPAAFNGNNGNFAVVTANNGAGAAEIRTSGRAAADRLVPVGTYNVGTACADAGAIARNIAGTGLLVCQVGVWRNLSVAAAAGDACATDGATAKDGNDVLLICMNGQYRAINTIVQSGVAGTACPTAGTLGIDTTSGNGSLICRANPAPGGGVARWMRLQDITSNLSFVTAVEVTEGAVVAKPACTPGAGMTGMPLIQLIPKSFSSPDSGFAFYADSAVAWTVHMVNGAGTALAGTPYAVAQVFCYFP